MDANDKTRRSENNQKLKLPAWFDGFQSAFDDFEGRTRLKTDLEKSASLASSREEMCTALNLYNSHGKLVITLISASIVALGYAMGQTEIGQSILPYAPIVIYVFALISIAIMYQYYDVYVCALLFASILHCRANVIDLHGWLAQVESDLGELVKKHEDDKSLQDMDAFRCWRVLHPRFSFFPYSILILILGLAPLGLPLLCAKSLNLGGYLVLLCAFALVTAGFLWYSKARLLRHYRPYNKLSDTAMRWCLGAAAVFALLAIALLAPLLTAEMRSSQDTQSSQNSCFPRQIKLTLENGCVYDVSAGKEGRLAQ